MMHRSLRLFALLLPLVSALPAGAVPFLAEPDPASDPCAVETARVERERGIPAGLLRAISLAESGRMAPGTKRTVAWPWTIWADGEGKFFPTKAEAIAAVEKLQARGIRSIDVGCMQVNLHFHRQAFASLQEAFDPKANVRYAADFLGTHREREGSWTRAVGYYHSATPELNRAYTERVMARWNGAGVRAAAAEPARPGQIPGSAGHRMSPPPGASDFFASLVGGSAQRPATQVAATPGVAPGAPGAASASAPTVSAGGKSLADYRAAAIPVTKKR